MVKKATMISKENQVKFEALIKEIKDLLPETTTAIRLLITHEACTLQTTYQHPEQLTEPVKNIKGEWIVNNKL